jgi:hypothetical protein
LNFKKREDEQAHYEASEPKILIDRENEIGEEGDEKTYETNEENREKSFPGAPAEGSNEESHEERNEGRSLKAENNKETEWPREMAIQERGVEQNNPFPH